MNVPITFPSVPARDLSDEALVMEAEIEGYLVDRNANNSIRVLGRNGETARKDRTRYHLKQLRAIPSTIHGMMEFPTRWGIATVLSQTPTILECRREEKKQAREKEKDPVEEVKSKGNPSPTEPVLVNPAYLEQLVKIGTNLSLEGSTQLKNLLKKNKDIFAWEPSDINRNITKENKEDYRWTEEAEKAFQELKKTILSLPTLATPIPEENLYVYLAASDKAVSANYAPLEKLALALRNASRRLRRYFEAHPITVITDQPIKQILGKAEASGRLAQYAVELGAYKITYEPRNSIKGQVLADFLNEIPVGDNALVPRETTYTKEDQKDRQEEWMLLNRWASSFSKRSGAGHEIQYINPTKTNTLMI
ncbi:reverse transcriptase domain-containing protein [Tanacetum coccineum]